MQGIEFDKDTYRPKGVPSKNSWAIEFVIKASGYRITDPAKASFVLVIIFILLMGVAFYNFSSFSNTGKLSKDEMSRQQELFLDQARATELTH